MELWEMEVQNRAWALESNRRILERGRTGDELLFLSTWIEWENFLKEQYAPYARKYGLTQEPERSALRRAGFAVIGATVLPDRTMYQVVLDSTIDYLERLRPIADLAPEEDAEFFAFVVRQEEVQVEALRRRVEGEHQNAANVLLDFMRTRR